LSVSRSKNSTSLYVIKSIYNNGVRSTKVVERLGTVEELKKKLNGEDPFEWAKKYIEELNKKEKELSREIMVKYSPRKQLVKGQKKLFNGGYLFLQKVYHELGLHKIANTISKKYKFTFDLNSVFSRLLYSRIIFPSSKLATYQLSQKFLEPINFELQHIYRALEIISKEMDYIQATLYKNSLKVAKRNTNILYYDCTNYFFEIEEESGLKQYGASKEHKPNPIVQMGLFMDGNGIPLAFNINQGNTNEQITLKPLEEKILSDFNLSKFVVCTDAGLASENNRRFNSKGDRAFITTQSIKKLKKHLKDWVLDTKGWYLNGSNKTYDISNLDEDIHKESIFYKERWIKENDFEQRLIVTYSIKYRNYQREIRNSQIDRALKTINNNSTKIKVNNQNDYRRFIKRTSCTEDGEIAQKDIYTIDISAIAKEEVFDGFYGVCTNLEGPVKDIIKINQRRWEIEECFRILKTELKSRPVYLSRDDRIKAHFTTCFIALIIYRLVEYKLGNKYTCRQIIDGLREMNFLEIHGEGYTPAYTRTDFTDDLHEAFGFNTDYEIIPLKEMKKIFKLTKK
jgi:transposase